MKSFYGYLLFALVGITLSLTLIGCPAKTNPTTVQSNPTDTYTKTTTPANTQTKTNTPTATLTGPTTVTLTLTDTTTPTVTATVTSTVTTTDTPGNTSTVTSTSTPADTATVTSTVTQTTTPTTVPPPCTLVLNDCSNLTVNGNWTGYNSTITLSASNGVASSNSVDVDVTTGATSNKVAILDSFNPALMNPVGIVIDITVDASVTTGAGSWCQIQLQADQPSASAYEVNASATNPTIVGGSQSVTFGLDSLTANKAITKLYFAVNEQNPTTGNIYIGDVKVLYSSACQSMPTPVVADTWDFEGQSLTNTLGTWGISGDTTGIGIVSQGQDSSYSMGVTGSWPASYSGMQAVVYFGPNIDVSSFNGIQAWIYLPATELVGNGPGAMIQITDGTGSSYPESNWTGLDHGGWVYVNYPISSFPAGIDKTTLHMIQIVVQPDWEGSVTYPTPATDYFLVDNVGFY